MKTAVRQAVEAAQLALEAAESALAAATRATVAAREALVALAGAFDDASTTLVATDERIDVDDILKRHPKLTRRVVLGAYRKGVLRGHKLPGSRTILFDRIDVEKWARAHEAQRLRVVR
jgi:shikimate kinase